ncbi:glycoside hydrolase family 97 catalytic domain-containing protein [Luteolibacter ambystomatis]|uniref:Glycoside hydrolase family 97 catalytic domain-containing protein n=1 Tax=Luteolibacter ambystomatis TaxID=2824561 RepID=A0A975IXT1_9BACT|nr:glycoside hydrolase family 97 protein [Luteolibacter ambystomatis]QUE49517.1 glycoside hydrolase family 97 catalytic domain-containing protein [Luteolibacter ambystomatis]
MLLLSAASASAADYATLRTVRSPGGRSVFTLEKNETTGELVYGLTSGGRTVVNHGDLGLELRGVGVVAARGTLGKMDAKDIDTTWSNSFGEASTVQDRCREETLPIIPTEAGLPEVKLQVRAYDTGVAWRYLLAGDGTVTDEATSFTLPEATQVWTSTTAQGPITRQLISEVKGQVERPLFAQLAPDLFAAIGEAGLVDGARMKFVSDGAVTLRAKLAGGVAFTDSFTSPWRYVRVGGSPAALLQDSGFILNLNEPSKIADISWIRPGKVIREASLTTQGGKACIDFAAAHGLQHILFDAGWYGPEGSASSDATKVDLDPARSPGPLDLQMVIAYGKQKGIGVILYVNQIALTRQIDEIAPLYQSWGAAGIKFGFVKVGPQGDTAWLHKAVAKCAEHKLMVDIHDEYRPTGVSRAWPNLLTQEGIRGDEESVPNIDVLKTIFTRCLAGAADQTNCYFAPRVTEKMGSHASQLAKAVCIFSPWQMLYWYDRPMGSPGVGQAGPTKPVIQEVPELSFFDRLPTTWDETRVLDGHPDTHVTIARRKGDVWFVGGLNGNSARTFEVPLAFLDPAKTYQAEVFRDDPAVSTLTHVAIDKLEVNAKTVLKREVAAGNGFAVILTAR